MNQEIKSKVSLYVEMIEEFINENVNQILLVDVDDTLFASLLYENMLQNKRDFTIDVAYTDMENMNRIRMCAWIHKIIKLNTDQFNNKIDDYDIVIIGSSLRLYDILEVKRILTTLLTKTKSCLLCYMEDYYSMEAPSLSFSDLNRFDFSYRKLSSSGLNVQLYKIFPLQKRPYNRLTPLDDTIVHKYLNITFVVPHRNLTGGLKMLYMQMKHLQQRGHKITLLAKTLDHTVTPSWLSDFTPDNEIIIPLDGNYHDFIKNCDIVIVGFVSQLNEFNDMEIPIFYWEQGHESLYGDYPLKQEKIIREHLTFLYPKIFI